ncbi:MAG: DUF1064 domain-containing protein [Chloroflexi bacterium]|nr:DUF1064 domain-containing protein [Chloroflexota bacterium]
MPVRLSDLKGLSQEARRAIRTAVQSVDDGGPSLLEALEDEAMTLSKWHNRKTVVDGITFDSEREAERYSELVLEQQAGTISGLARQKQYRLDVNGFHIANYVADFVYERAGETIVEDVKSNPTKTGVYCIKKKLMQAIHGIEIHEVF